MECASKTNTAIDNVNLEFLSIFLTANLPNQFIDFHDRINKSLLHRFRSQLQFLNESVNFIDEKNWLDSFFQCLPENCFCLRHDSFNCANKNNTTVNRAHSSRNVSSKVNVTRSID